MILTKIINRFPVEVDVYQPRSGGGIFIKRDRVGPFAKQGGGTEYRLKKLKHVLHPQLYENFIQRDGKLYLPLWNPSQGVYEPMKAGLKEKVDLQGVKIEGFTLSADEIAWKENFMNNVERIFIVFHRKGFMDKYGQLIMLMVFGFFIMGAFVLARQDLYGLYENFSQSLAGAVSSIQSAAGNVPPIK